MILCAKPWFGKHNGLGTVIAVLSTSSRVGVMTSNVILGVRFLLIFTALRLFFATDLRLICAYSDALSATAGDAPLARYPSDVCGSLLRRGSVDVHLLWRPRVKGRRLERRQRP